MEITSGLAFLASLMAIAVSVYHARFARFASEKWWERKAEAYSKIIEALSDLVFYYDELLDLYTKDMYTNGDEEANSFYRKKIDAIDEQLPKKLLAIRNASNVGGFLILEKAEKSLQVFLEPDDTIHPANWNDGLYSLSTKARTCLKDLKSFAKEDLRL